MNETAGCANTINSPEFLIIIATNDDMAAVRNFTRVDIFAIDPISVYILIDVVHRPIKCTEIYIRA